ncbi:lipid A biosynthesis acyltransferase, partial [Acinetobacter baumannii]
YNIDPTEALKIGDRLKAEALKTSTQPEPIQTSVM